MDIINVNVCTMSPTMEGYGHLPHHAVRVRVGHIAGLVPMSAYQPTPGIAQLDGQGQWLTPGFIDFHTHLVYGGSRVAEFEQRLNGVPYTTIQQEGGGILATMRATRQASQEELLGAALPRAEALIKEGVTHLEIKSGYGMDVETELKMLRVAKEVGNRLGIGVSPTLLCCHALPPEYAGRAEAFVQLVCEEMIPRVVREGLAEAVDVFCETIGFSADQCERVFQTAQHHGLAIKAHAEQLSLQGGAALAARYGGLSADHLEYVDEEGVRAMAASGTVAGLLPGAFYCLRETQLPPIDLFRKHKVPMALSTDFNPGTSPLASQRLMLNMACTLFRLTPLEALAGVTLHAAAALGLQAEMGSVEVGKVANLLLWRIDHPAQLAHEYGPQRLVHRIVNGVVQL
eukprot:NODE_2086_length_1284_cov_20.232498_g1985_i0.p1 GENE.NODE_2086_length_1284_cov_20.232498_g1985_i0~~NODE_2086_length_1284_cov_20.232498_g1985_i0.p1  ORF type:complete len:401 (-),score=106.90 NODE_2086_length_1284_cov_20.232498_g1985_i0:15-1217(-)